MLANGMTVSSGEGIEGKMGDLSINGSSNGDGATEASDSMTEQINHERLGAEMQERCRILVAELEEYQEYLRKQKKESSSVELRTFRSGLNAEMKLINKLATKDSSNLKIAHSLRSSNFLFYASLWSTAKTCRGITALSRRFYWEPDTKTATINGRNHLHGAKKKSHSAVADIVCEDGLEWVKVSSNTEKRIIWDLAKAGWVPDSDSEDEEEGGEGGDAEGLLKQVETLVKAAKATRVRYRNPIMRLVLPRISREPEAKEVGIALQKLRNLGVIIQTKEDLGEEPKLVDVVEKLMPDRYEKFSEVLNIDCTVLLAFVSDISHGTVEEADWHNKMIKIQRKLEAEEHLLPSILWPACASKTLVCTREAATRMLEIVNTIGTDTEKVRTSLLLRTPIPQSPPAPLTQSETIAAFQAHSQYSIPSTWQIPIQIIDIDIPSMLAELPASATIVAERLSEMNKSVLLYGWWSGRTTITSNRAVVRDVEGPVEEFRIGEERGPDIWSCIKPRSLVGKEKERRGKVE